MNKINGKTRKSIALFLFFIMILASCQQQIADDTYLVELTPTSKPDLPEIISVELDRENASKYEPVEITLSIAAKYSNPYDLRDVAVDGVFYDPDGGQMRVPGFWDGERSWMIRFTPSREGAWKYSIYVKDSRGSSDPYQGVLDVAQSDLHGWIIPGDSFDPSYSPHYLVYHDGTPFYGIGYCEALNILIDGFDAEDGVGLFDDMKETGANYVVWWPMYTNSIVASSYDTYSFGNMKVIDAVIRDAEKEGILIVFTIWDHPNLRDDTHAWGDGNWERNGFSQLGDINSFFVSDESWAWQENMYRYVIARWGYSTSIAMWQTVSEINGTNAYAQTDAWHEKVNKYFVENDPYRHPTTSSGSGEVDWPIGHAVMDMPQMHVYEFPDNDTIQAAEIVAGWTQRMLKSTDKPNWIGEFGVTGNSHYPELFHNSIWAALASGASMTPAEWNSGGSWGRMTPEMNADLHRLSIFVADLHLAELDPSELWVEVNDENVRGWGIAGQEGGMVWVQDYSLEGGTIEDIRNLTHSRSGVQVELIGLETGIYEVAYYDTWQGVFLDISEIKCEDTTCVLILPDFYADLAIRLTMRE